MLYLRKVLLVSPMLLWMLQCNGLSNDVDVLNIPSLNTIKLGDTSLIFDHLPQNVFVQYSKSEDSIIRKNVSEGEAQGNLRAETPRPLYQLFKNILSSSEHNEIAEFVRNGGLGHDYTSEHFLERYKNIRYVKVLIEGFEILEKNFFEQDATHNDFSGGYRRYYELIPEQIMMGPMYNLISIFIDNLKIPVGTIFMAVLQSSTLRADVDDHGGDVTGQGIHTDGVEDIMLVCVDRENVQGAVNEFHGTLDGTQLLHSAVLETGDGVMVQDNKVFHHVTEATTTAPIAHRTVIILLTPNDGTPECPENKLGGNDADIKLRHYAKDNSISTEEETVNYDKHPQNVSVKNVKSDVPSLNKKEIEEQNNERNDRTESHRPLYQLFENILSPTEHTEIAEFVRNGGLGHDYTSEHFLERYKNIRYVKVLTEGFEITEKNFFEQDATHNFSGGYRRYYELIPEQIMMGPMYNLISIFIDNLKIPVGTIFMAVLQSSTLRADVDDHGGDVTGQGIHTDGVEDIMLVCVDRENVQGAVNEFHGTLDGTKLLHSAILETGDGVLVQDNKVFHHVTKATTTATIAHRTVIILLTPNDGTPECPENKLGGNDAEIKLRHYAKDISINKKEKSNDIDKHPINVSAQNIKHNDSIKNNMNSEEQNSQKNNETESLRPLYQLFENVLSPSEHNEIAEFVRSGGLGHDYTSEHFLERYKNIRYVKVLTEGFELLEKNYFEQDATHNDFSGGYRRYYDLIPEPIMMGPMSNLISIFIDNLNIPVGTIFMAVLQSSTLRADVDDHGGDVTGQGIHTDGVEDIMLVCVDRENVQGAVNEFHGTLDGTQLLHSAILETGDGVLVQDNKVFHHVTEATTTAPIAHRTVIILLTPNDGTPECPENKLGGNDADIKLRHYARDITLNSI